MRQIQSPFIRRKLASLHCEAWAIIDLIQECMEIGAPVLQLNFQYNNRKHCVGIESVFSERSGFFDTELFLDSQRFDSLCAFISSALIDGVEFANIHELEILRNRYTEYRWAYTLLANHIT